MMCVDWWQLQPVTGICLCSNPIDVDAGRAQQAMNLLWDYGVDTIRNFWQLKELMRCKDEWYNDFLQHARNGNMPTDMYCFSTGCRRSAWEIQDANVMETSSRIQF